MLSNHKCHHHTVTNQNTYESHHSVQAVVYYNMMCMYGINPDALHAVSSELHPHHYQSQGAYAYEEHVGELVMG